MNNSTTYSISKQGILKRMLHFAANYLGVKQIELLDPIVVLFTEAVAEEIYTVSSEISSIEVRMLNTLAGLIVPDISLSAHPAHCILHALPEEGKTLLSSKTAFVWKDKKRESQNLHNLTFYPLRNTIVHNGGIRYISFNGLLYQVDDHQSKTLISRSRNVIQSKNVWIGMELDESTPNLKNLSFYIDFLSISNKDEILKLLPHSIWKLNGEQINIKQGLHWEQEDSMNETVKIFKDFTTASNLDDSIWNNYNKYFLTVSDSITSQDYKISYPDELKKNFPPHIFEDLTKPIIWFEVEFPSMITPAVLDNMIISINAFPIVNKNRHIKTIEIQKSLSIIPLETGDHESLLSIESISDSEGCIYTDLPFSDTNSANFGTYSLRRGGYERYSKREMREYLLLLAKRFESLTLEENKLLENENETSNNGILQVQKLLKHIKDLINNSKEKLEVQYYISIDQLKKDDVFFVKYNTTNCELANNIKQYSIFDSENTDILLKPLSLFTLSGTSGGKSTPSIADIDNLQIKALTTQSMLVTNNDIIEYCKSNFSMIAHVEVKNGIMENPINKEELLCTKDVLLSLREDTKLLFKEIDSQLLERNLRALSPETFNYRIIIK